MNHTITFADLVEAVDQLSEEEKETLIGIVQRRQVERRRKRQVRAVKQSRRDYAAGHYQVSTPTEIIKKVESLASFVTK